MKKVLLGVFAVSLLTASLHAQEGCGTGRYNTEVFPNFTLTSDISYGNNPAGAGDLKLDVYEPTGDNIAERPLIILAHGGSFMGGNKTDDPAVTESCKRFAKMGYVTASISYSLGFDQLPPGAESAARTVYRVAREMKAAIRFFRKDAATTNTYKINPNFIFIGGNSAGGILSLHTAFLDQNSELPAGINTATLGDIEANQFGNAGYSSKVTGVINMAGAIGDTAWFDNNRLIPVVSAHGDADATVPYGSATITLLGFPIMPVDGSGSIDIYTNAHSMTADLLVFPGDDHCPWNSNATKMTQMIEFNRDFLYPIVCSNTGILTPVTDFTASATNVGMGQFVTLTQTALNNPMTFEWTITPNTVSFEQNTAAFSANPVVSFSATGQYSVTLKAINAAGDDEEIKTSYITVYDNASINEANQIAVSVYPNPASDQIFVQLPNTLKSVTYKVLDMTGKSVVSGNKMIENGNFSISTENLANGIYTIQIQSGDVMGTSKTVISK